MATAERDGVQVVLIGPDSLEVGEPGRYSARVESEAQLIWLTDDGPLDGSQTLEVIPDEAGTVRITLLAVSEGKPSLRVELLTRVDP